jgi:hypothetical protein
MDSKGGSGRRWPGDLRKIVSLEHGLQGIIRGSFPEGSGSK